MFTQFNKECYKIIIFQQIIDHILIYLKMYNDDAY